MQDRSHFIACMTPAYFDSLEQQTGRPYQELKAAAAAMSSQRIVCVNPEGCQPVTSQRVQQLPAVELRKAFVTRPQVRPRVLCTSRAGLHRFPRLYRRPGGFV